ncbi:MAG TPA: DUF1844 domain-containing protein [Terriglobales bacterium]|nr:DUF1844 domain-containing protein [Terriglobales bacterium]
MADKKSEFVVTDKRKFTSEGELRPETQGEERPAPKPPEPPAAAVSKKEAAPPPADQPAVPPAPSAAEQQAQDNAYRDSGKQFERAAFRGRTPQDYEMNFERLVASLYMTAMMQMGLVHEEGQQPVADLLGAKQTIDTLGLLQEKTKGNLTDQEQHLLQNCLYELRMGFVELTNALARQAPPDLSAPGGKPK